MKKENKKKEEEKIKVYHYEGWRYNNEYNLTPENETLIYSKAEKPDLTEIKLVNQEN